MHEGASWPFRTLGSAAFTYEWYLTPRAVT